jgi:hypothetical protein
MKERWMSWFEKYRGMELADLVLAGIRTLLSMGSVTSDDLRRIPLRGDPRIRGGAMKALVSLGVARKGEQVNSGSELCHHRPIQRFDLADAGMCRRILARYETAVLGGIPSGQTEKCEQGSLAI